MKKLGSSYVYLLLYPNMLGLRLDILNSNWRYFRDKNQIEGVSSLYRGQQCRNHKPLFVPKWPITQTASFKPQ